MQQWQKFEILLHHSRQWWVCMVIKTSGCPYQRGKVQEMTVVLNMYLKFSIMYKTTFSTILDGEICIFHHYGRIVQNEAGHKQFLPFFFSTCQFQLDICNSNQYQLLAHWYKKRQGLNSFFQIADTMIQKAWKSTIPKIPYPEMFLHNVPQLIQVNFDFTTNW